MRTWASLLAVALVAALVSGCVGGPREAPAGPGTSSDGTPTTSPARYNEPPAAVARVLNASLVETPRQFVGENVTFSAKNSSDADGSIAEYTWRVIEDGVYATKYGDLRGPEVTIKFLEPGDRSVTLFVEDDEGSVDFANAYFSVHQHVLGSGQLLPGPTPVVGVSSAEYVMPVRAGAILLSINANFTPMELTQVRLELRLPNGTALNTSAGAKSPLWSIALPPQAVVGNFTAVIHLAQGLPLDYRLEFAAWYGYGL